MLSDDRRAKDSFEDAVHCRQSSNTRNSILAHPRIPARAKRRKPEGGSIKHDVSVPVAAVPDFMDEATAAVEKMIPGCRVAAFGHLGDGNIHYNVSQPVGADKNAFLDRWEEMNEIVHGIVAKHAGSISAEHGIGVLKRDLLPGVKDPTALDIMHTLKRTLDPNGILNPGKVL